MHQSIATINSPEFINLKPLDINPLMSECEIKVLYLGENRNKSFISKEVATDMAKTLRGAPIVGYYKEKKEDFDDHGNLVTIDSEGISFRCLTKPYGFVSPSAKVWFQTFEDTDDFGNTVIREYLMTTGYLWTGQFEECRLASTDTGRPHSMELDEETLKGYSSKNPTTGMDFYIINDATFSKLCILGEDVEPCFEGCRISAPKISSSFTKVDDGFKKTLFTMMQELKFALQGGPQMEMNKPAVEEVEIVVKNTDPIAETAVDFAASEAPAVEEVKEIEGKVEEVSEAPIDAPEAKEVETEFVETKKEEEKEDKEDKKEESDTQKASKEEKDDEEDKDDDDEEKKKYALLEQQYSALKDSFEVLQKEYNELLAFKAKIDDAKKDEMIEKFSMLSIEDKKDVIENKSKYTVEEIESKLSVIYTRSQQGNFSLEDTNKNDIKTEEPCMVYSIKDQGASIPAWISAVKNIQNTKN